MRSASILLSTLLISAAVAAEKPGRNAPAAPAVDPDRDYKRLHMDPAGQPLPADTAESDAAKKDLDDAKTALTKALGQATVTTAYQIDNALFKNEDYRKAAIDLRRAQAEYDTVRAPIFAALREDDLYKELLKQDEENEKIIRALVIMGRGNFDWLIPTATASLQVHQRMTREQIIAMAQAPEVEEARQRMLVAAAKVRGLRGDYVSQNVSAPAAKAAQADVDDARQKVRDAQAAYNAALAKEAQYERIRLNYLAEQRLTGKAPAINAK